MIAGNPKALFLLVVFSLSAGANGWRWRCNSDTGYCTRFIERSTTQVDYPSIEVCRLLCGKFSALWPQPTATTHLSQVPVDFDVESVHFNTNLDSDAGAILRKMVDVFIGNIKKERVLSCVSENKLNIVATVKSSATDLDISINEGYDLQIRKSDNIITVNIVSTTIFGARHGLETLSQLITSYTFDDGKSCLITVEEANISDSPLYKYRGLLLDTARNFLPVDSIARHIDAMGASKLNVLHWHATDSQSWPLQIPNVPNMVKYGAYSMNKTYSPDDVAFLLEYAKLRGIMILLEIDAPSHSGNGWQWGPEAALGDLAVCVNEGPWRSLCIEPPCGQLNPANQNLYSVLEQIYGDINSRFPTSMFHMGGDEVFFPCWNSSEEILRYIGNKPRTIDTFLDLWSEFQQKTLAAFDKAASRTNTPIILWSSHLTQPEVIEKYLSKDRYIIQTWVPKSEDLPQRLIQLGYKLIISTKDAWYLDHGLWGTTPYYDWIKVYSNILPSSKQVLGGEVCMWGEYIDETGVEGRTWPRAAAAAERLWAQPRTDIAEASPRYYRHRHRLVTRGIRADAVGPQWCYQNEGLCR